MRSLDIFPLIFTDYYFFSEIVQVQTQWKCQIKIGLNYIRQLVTKNELGPMDNKASPSHIYNPVKITKISSINFSSHTWFATSHLPAHAKPFQLTSHIQTNAITWVNRFSSRQSATKCAISLVCYSYSVSVTMYRLIFD